MISSPAGAGKERVAAAVPKAAAEPAEDRPVIIEGRGIGVSFKGVRALSDVDIEVRAGEVFGLLGPNGAGKSTLLGVLSGLLRPDTGEVYVAGVHVTREAPHRRAARGLARTFQHPQLFTDLTVGQHLRLAYRLHHERMRLWSDLVNGAALRPPSSEESRVVGELLELLQLQEIAGHPVVGLPLGTGRLVEVAQALAARPKVVLLDEPSSGLDPQETKRLVTALSDVVAAHGVSLLLVEHDVEMVMGISDTIQVLEFGQTIAVGTPAEVRVNAAVKSAYLGDQLDASDEAKPRARVVGGTAEGHRAEEPPARPLLRVDHLCATYGDALALDNVSLQVMPGSVLALLGANGAGKSTLGRVLSGLIPAASGRIEFDGVGVTTLPGHEIRQRGLVYLPEGRGVFPSLTVADNLKLAVRTLPKPEREGAVGTAMTMFPILGQRRRQLAGQLSGGEQQMLSLARALAVGPRLVIADEMSLGLAPKIVDQVFDALRAGIDSGITVIIIEQLVHQALSMADQCCILRRGQVAWSGAATAVDGILDHYLGSAPEPGATDGQAADPVGPADV
jgi:ABC-type branched-subunit amino acid transport system ATPase component